MKDEGLEIRAVARKAMAEPNHVDNVGPLQNHMSQGQRLVGVHNVDKVSGAAGASQVDNCTLRHQPVRGCGGSFSRAVNESGELRIEKLMACRDSLQVWPTL